MKRCAIIGSGIGGLASAILLAKDGWHVDVYEKNECLGGRASVFEEAGFRFDMGPSWYLMPDIFEDFFKRIGENINDHLDLVKLDPSYAIYFHDGERVTIVGDKKKDRKVIEKLEPGTKDKFLDYIDKSEYQYDIGMKFCYKNYDSIFDFLSWEVAKEGTKLSVFTSMRNYVRRFFKSDKVQKIMQYPLVFLGTSPYEAPALYNIMSHVDFNMGVFYPQGGMHSFINVLEKLGKKYDVHYHTNTPVKKLHVGDGKISTVELDNGKFISYDIVVCNADQARSETNLLEKKRQSYDTSYWKSKKFAPSAFIIYLGIDKKIPELIHHNLIFSQDWKKNFAAIFGSDKELPEDPSMYICKPSDTDPSVAPVGKENLFILVPIPCGYEISKQQEDAYKQFVYDQIESLCKISFQKDIVYERVFHSKDFADRYNAWQGTALGLSHTLMQTAIFRPNNISKKVSNLFYVGHTTNPGIGMPMVLISSLLAKDRIDAMKHK